MARHLTIAGTSENAVMQAMRNNKILDFEDGLQYYSAVESNCDCIVTENIGDYYFSELEVQAAGLFLKNIWLVKCDMEF